jgi:ribonuclease PH
MGKTRVLCVATVQQGVPPFLEGRGSGWLTADYAMLPGSTDVRKPRGADGRAREIGRLVARSLRAAVDLKALGPRTIYLDCDVLQAHGGTRTASVTGAWVALAQAVAGLEAMSLVNPGAVKHQIAAVSAGIVSSTPLLDLDRDEDREASADLNVVMSGDGRFIEIQGTAEKELFDQEELEKLLSLARRGVKDLFKLQTAALEKDPPPEG